MICGEIRSASYDVQPIYTTNVKDYYCLANCFNWREWKTVPLNQCPELEREAEKEALAVFYNLKTNEESYRFPIEKCHGVIGFPAKAMAEEIQPKTKRLNSIFLDKCK